MKKFSKVVALVAAMMLLAGLASAAETKAYYQFGGAQVTWAVDIDGDGENDTEAGVNGSTWVGTLDGGNGTVTVPVKAGDTVEVICQSWDSYPETVIFTATANGETKDCYYNKPVSFTATADGDFSIEIAWGEGVDTGEVDDDGNPVLDATFNDWCGSAIVVTSSDAADAPATDAPATDAPATDAPAQDNTPSTGDATSIVMLSAVAVLALAGVVVSKKRA